MAFLGAIALSGVLSFAVSQRTREIGVRMVAGHAAKLLGVGVVVGGGLGVAVGVALRSQLFGVKPADPVTFLAVVGLLATVALVAAVVPARRAARVDPVVTLRAE